MSTPIPEGSVIITPMEVYREMQATHQAVQNVATKLDAALEANDRRLTALDGPDGELADHEARLRTVERDKADKAEVEALRSGHGSRLSAVEKRVWMGLGIGTVAAIGCSGLITYLASVR